MRCWTASFLVGALGLIACSDSRPVVDEVLQGFPVVYGNPEYSGWGFDPNPWADEVVADPVEVASPDGRWRFSLIPWARDFDGPSRARLECEGRLVW